MIPLRDENPSHRFPFVVIAIIVLCCLGFWWEVASGPDVNAMLNQYAVIPSLITSGDGYFTLFTSMFLHGGIGHLIGNMWYLWIFGDNLEDYFGHFVFLLFYLATGVAAGLIHAFLYPTSTVPTIGASGAISGIMGGYIVLHPRIRIVTLVPIVVFLKIVRIPAVFFLGIWFAMNFFGIFGADEGIAFAAHVGGFVTGALLTLLFTRKRPGGAHATFESGRLRRW